MDSRSSVESKESLQKSASSAHVNASSKDYRRQEEEKRLQDMGRALLGWSQNFLGNRGFEIETLTDFCDGVALINLLEECFGKSVGRYCVRPKKNFERIDNINIGLKFARSEGVIILGVSSSDIANRKLKALINTLYNILRTVTVRGLAEEDEEEKEKEKEKVDKPVKKVTVSVKKKLLELCQLLCKSDPTIEVKDLWKSFKDGRAICKIVEEICIDIEDANPNFSNVADLSVEERLNLAFKVSQTELNIPTLITAEQITNQKRDENSSFENYLCMLLSVAKGRITTIQEQKTKEKEEAERLEAENESKEQAEQMEQFKTMMAEQNEDLNNEKEQFKELSSQLGRLKEIIVKAKENEKKYKELAQKYKKMYVKKSEAEKSVKKLLGEANSQIYSLHKENENLVVRFKHSIQANKTKAKKVIAEQKAVIADKAIEAVEVTTAKKLTQESYLNALPNLSGVLLKRHPFNKFFKDFKKRTFVLKGALFQYYDGNKFKGEYDLRKVDLEVFDIQWKGVDFKVVPTKENKKDQIDIKIPDKPSKGDPTRQEWKKALNIRLAYIKFFETTQAEGSIRDVPRSALDFISEQECKKSEMEGDLKAYMDWVKKHSTIDIRNKIVSLRILLTSFKTQLAGYESLQNVNFENIGMHDKALKLFSDDVLKKNKNLRSLKFPNNNLTAKGVATLCDATERYGAIEELDLSNNRIGDEGLMVVAKAVKSNARLSKINLEHTDITDKGIITLVEAIEASTKKRKRLHLFPEIMVGSNAIGTEGCKAIARLCQGNKSVQRIDLSSNQVDDDGITALCEALTTGNCFISSLNLSGNEISNRGMKKLTRVIEETKKDLVVDLSFNHLIGRSGYMHLMELEQPLMIDQFKFTRKLAKQEYIDGLKKQGIKKQGMKARKSTLEKPKKKKGRAPPPFSKKQK